MYVYIHVPSKFNLFSFLRLCCVYFDKGLTYKHKLLLRGSGGVSQRFEVELSSKLDLNIMKCH